MTIQKLLSLAEFAKNMGATASSLRTASLPFHQAYHAEDSTPEIKANMKTTWVLNHLLGQSYDAKTATKLMGMTRVERNAKNVQYERAVNKAGQDFTYHVVSIRDAVKKAPKLETNARLSPEIKASATSLLNLFGGDINKAIKALRAVKK